MASLETLSAKGTELTSGQLDNVDGGMLPVIVGLVILDIYLWGKVYDKYSN